MIFGGLVTRCNQKIAEKFRERLSEIDKLGEFLSPPSFRQDGNGYVLEATFNSSEDARQFILKLMVWMYENKFRLPVWKYYWDKETSQFRNLAKINYKSPL